MVFRQLRLDQVNRAAEVRQFASGKAINVARAIRTMRAKAVVVGFAGGDGGRLMRQDLTAIGIVHQLVEVPEPTRLCLTLLDRHRQTATELVEESAAVPPGKWDQLSTRIKRAGRLSRVWVFSGSLPPGAPADFYARWAPIARQLDAKLILDARGEALRQALNEPGLIFKINREELGTVTHSRLTSQRELCRAMRQAARGQSTMIVTAGADGAWVDDGKQLWRIVPPPIKAVNPIGSGDAFAAGLAVGLARRQTLRDACRLAAACAAANALTDDAGHLEYRKAHELIRQVKIVSC